MQGTAAPTGPVHQQRTVLWWELPWLQGSQMVLGCQGESNQTPERRANIAFDQPSACRRLGHQDLVMSLRKEVVHLEREPDGGFF